jgi:hypothetical protein
MKVAKQHSHGMEPAVNGIWEYRLLLAITTLWLLPIAAISRLLPRSWRPLASFSNENEGIYMEARSAACRVIPCVFMG